MAPDIIVLALARGTVHLTTLSVDFTVPFTRATTRKPGVKISQEYCWDYNAFFFRVRYASIRIDATDE